MTLVLPLAALGCLKPSTERIVDSRDGSGGGSPATAPGPAPGSPAGPIPAPVAGAGGNSGVAPCTTAEPSPSPLRRLTRIEYNNTVRDLFGFDLAPADKFPPDEVAGGFSNNASVLTVSPLLAEHYLEAAEALSAEAGKNLSRLLPCDPVATGEEACARRFVERFARRAYRRPPAVAEIDRLMRAYTAGRALAGGSFAAGIELSIQTALQSPSFLYRFEFGANPRPGEVLVPLSQHELATRLSYLLWGSMPDDALAGAADAGQLATLNQLATRARAMLADARARPAVGEFYRQWLGLGSLATLTKDPGVHPDFDEPLRAAMRAEAQAFVEHVMWSADGRLATLLTAPLGFVTAPLARLYGVTAPAGLAPQMVMLPAAERAGVLTLPGVLAVHALPNQTSPVLRGKFVRENFLCQHIDPPPPDLNVTPPEVDPSRSTRERFAQHTTDAACSVCHKVMDPIGFGFEAYDAVGRFRTSDSGRAVDDTGEIIGSRDVDGTFRGARGLADKLAASGEVRDCVATQWFRYAFGRYDGSGDTCSLRALRHEFTRTGGDLEELLVALTQTEAFLTRRAPAPGEVMP